MKTRTKRWRLASKCAARRALNALWTSLARLGGRLSLRFLPRFEDIGEWGCAGGCVGASMGWDCGDGEGGGGDGERER